MDWWRTEEGDSVSLRLSALPLALRGYGRAKARDLAKAASLSVGAFYRRYGSKEGFAQTVREWTDSELSQRAWFGFELGLKGEPAGDYREGFFWFWKELTSEALVCPEVFCFTFLHWHPDTLQPEAHGSRARAVVMH